MKKQTFDSSIKNTYTDFLDLAFRDLDGKNGLSKKELDSYAETFVKYLNVASDIEKNATEEPKNTKKEVNIHKFLAFKYILTLIGFMGVMVALLIWTLFMFGSGLIDIEPQGLNVYGYILFGIGMLAAAFGCAKMVNYIERLHYDCKNSPNLQIGEVYIYNLMGRHYPAVKHRSAVHPLDHGENEQTAPILVRIINITNYAVYFLGLDDGTVYRLPLNYAPLLTKCDDTANKANIVVRYPLEMPTFRFSDVKTIEAAAILANKTGNSKLYEAINDVIAKIRFYEENPYAGAYEEVRDQINANVNNFKDFLFRIGNINDQMSEDPADLLEDSDDEEDDE